MNIQNRHKVLFVINQGLICYLLFISIDEPPGSTNSSPPDSMYVGQVIYKSKHHNRWKMQFMVAKHLNGLQEVNNNTIIYQ